MGVKEHKERARRIGEVPFGVLTTSDTRLLRDDVSGARARELLEAAGHRLVDHRLVPNEAALIREAVQGMLAGEARLIITTGGTGCSPQDLTADIVREVCDKELTGFGELFRRLSFEEVGTAAIMSRATLGVVDGKALCALPGSPEAVELGVKRIVLPELRHILSQAARGVAR